MTPVQWNGNAGDGTLPAQDRPEAAEKSGAMKRTLTFAAGGLAVLIGAGMLNPGHTLAQPMNAPAHDPGLTAGYHLHATPIWRAYAAHGPAHVAGVEHRRPGPVRHPLAAPSK